MAKDINTDDSVVGKLIIEDLITDDLTIDKDMFDLIKVLANVNMREKIRVIDRIETLNQVYNNSQESND